MGKIHNNQSGFGAVEGMLVLVIVALIAVVGIMVYKNDNKTSNSTTTASTTKTSTSAKTTTAPDPYAGWKTYDTKLKTSFDEEADISFKYPADWVQGPTQPTNGISLQSPDYKSTQGFANISAGSALLIAVDVNSKDINNHTPTLEEKADAYMGVSNKHSVTVNGVEALQFTTNGEEDHSLNFVTLLIKGDKIYRIVQMYNLNSDNPYPKLIEGVLATFTIKN